MKDNIVLEAQRRAEQILSQARADAEATRRDADDYIVETLMNLQSQVEKTLNQIQNGNPRSAGRTIAKGDFNFAAQYVGKNYEIADHKKSPQAGDFLIICHCE